MRRLGYNIKKISYRYVVEHIGKDILSQELRQLAGT